MNYEGNDNYSKPKSEYIESLKGLNDVEFDKACEEMIWLSAYANNNPRSDYHWQCDACYDESIRRDKPDIYANAHKRLVAQYR